MIEDTSKRDPLVHFAGSMSPLGLSGYITEMESAGQAQLVTSEELPRQARPDWEAFEALGIHRGEDTGGEDGLFCTATLPVGWSRQRSDSLWSHIVDERGVARVAIFYKAVFYDRDAFMHIERPGASLASQAIYGDGPARLPDEWDVLTDEEKADFRASLHDYKNRATAPRSLIAHIYDRLPRVETLIKLSAGDTKQDGGLSG